MFPGTTQGSSVCTVWLLVWFGANLRVPSQCLGSETSRQHCAQMRPSPLEDAESSAAPLRAVPCNVFLRPGPVLFARLALTSCCCSQLSCSHVALRAAMLFEVWAHETELRSGRSSRPAKPRCDVAPDFHADPVLTPVFS